MDTRTYVVGGRRTPIAPDQVDVESLRKVAAAELLGQPLAKVDPSHAELVSCEADPAEPGTVRITFRLA